MTFLCHFSSGDHRQSKQLLDEVLLQDLEGEGFCLLTAQLNSHWIFSLCLCKFPLQLKRHWVFFFHWLQLSSLTQLHFNGSEVIPLCYRYFAKSIWCEVDKKDNIAGSHSRTSFIILWTSHSTVFMSLHHQLTPPCQDVQWQDHLWCSPSSSAIRSSASFEP